MVFLRFFADFANFRVETEKINRTLHLQTPFSLKKLEIPKKIASFQQTPDEILEKSPEVADFMVKTANFAENSAKVSPNPLNSSDSAQKARKTPTKKFEFPNKIFDFKEIQSPNAVFKAYEQIFNEDDFSDGESAKSFHSDAEIQEKFPDFQKKSQKKTPSLEKTA